MLDAERATEDRVLMKRYVPAAVHGLFRAQRLIHANAPSFERETKGLRQVQVGLDTDGFQDQVGLFTPPVGERRRNHAVRLGVPRLDRGAGAHVHALGAVDLGVDLAHLPAPPRS